MACFRSWLAIAFFTGTASMVFEDMIEEGFDHLRKDRRNPHGRTIKSES